MKISFQNIDINNEIKMGGSNKAVQNFHEAGKTAAGSDSIKNGIRLDMDNKRRGLLPESSGGMNGKSISELQLEAGAVDVGVDRNYRIVMSNTMSEKDYAKAQKEGFDYSSMDPEDIVTIQDKVKAELAMSGVIIAGYNDNMDSKVLSEAVGSETLARDIKGSESIPAIFSEKYAAADIPMTEENRVQLEKALSLASELTEPTQGNVAYMIENELKPTIWNFYLAENSGSVQAGESDFNIEKNDTIVRQIDSIISGAGLNTSDETYSEAMKEAKWLLSNNLPITEDSLTNLMNIRAVEFPISMERFAASAAVAVAEGKEPIYADLTKTEGIYTLAAKTEEKYFSSEMWEATAGDITARRQLEEVRLYMTAEVNVKLIQSGFSIDTQPMEELIDALKLAESKVAAQYFDKYSESGEAAVSNYRLMKASNAAVQEIDSAPAAALGMFTARTADKVTLGEFHTESTALRDTYIKAGESYEALMTAPRADLGDRISKAFEGIGSLLDSLGIDTSEANLRAARILGYNSMEISRENLERIVYADRMVQSVVEKMTPASVLQMIREGVNPLANDFATLSKYFSEKRDEYREDSKDYSEFLYGLDMQDSISPEERESFIGIYRMLHQIEKADGAAIGAVINERAELDFNNLISAARSNRLKGVNVKIDDKFGATEELLAAANSITGQIATAFVAAKQQAEITRLRESVNVSADTTGMLKQYDIPASAENMEAMERLISVDSNLFEDVLKYAAKYDKKEKKNSTEELVNSFGTEDFDSRLEEFTSEMDMLSKEITFGADSYIDVKALSLIHLQLGMVKAINMKAEENVDKEFIVPYDTGVGIGKAHISFRQGEEGSPAKLDIKAQIGEGTAELHMSLNDNRLEGYFVGNTKDELQKMESISDILFEELKGKEFLSNLSVEEIPVFARNGEGDSNLLTENDYRSKDADGLNSEGTEKSVLLQVARIFLQSVRKA